MSHNSIIHPVGQPFIELITVDSTNNYAMQQLQSGAAQHGTVWFAYDQTAGKGQRGRVWYTQPGQNIAMSSALSTNGLAVSEQFYLSAAIALACRDTIAKYAGSETCVKWPNDIYWNDRKAGGILIENVVRGNNWQWAVAGTGLNINQTKFGDNTGRAVSVRQITGKTLDIIATAKELCANIDARYRQLFTGKDAIINDYNGALYKRGQKVRLKKDSIAFDAIIKQVLPDGRLQVEGAAWDTFSFGEIEWTF